MTFQQQILAQNRAAQRPVDAVDLLFTPIAPNPLSPGDWRASWLNNHGDDVRFYVGGLDWLLSESTMTIDYINGYRDLAVEAAETAGWSKVTGLKSDLRRIMRKNWGELSKPQVSRARLPQPLLFTKACLVILACELALENRLQRKAAGRLKEDDRPSDAITSSQEVYRRMAVVPACWNIDDFNEQYVKEQVIARPTFKADLAREISQPMEVIDDLAKGHTVTFPTADAIVTYCLNTAKSRQPAGTVRVHAGKTLGTKRAADNEKPLVDGFEQDD